MDDRKDQRLGEQQDDLDTGRRFNNRPGRLWAGLFLLLIGGVLLLDQMGFPLPDWLFSWHVLLIAVGLFLGLRHNFRGGAWLILILVGGCFVIQDFYPNAELRRFIAPCVLIFIGFIIMFRPRNRWRTHPWKDEWRDHMHQKWQAHRQWEHHQRHWKQHNHWGVPPQPTQPDPNPQATPNPNPYPNPEPNPQPEPGPSTSQTGGAFANSGSGSTGSGYSNSEDFIDTTSIFGGVHKKVVSKNFRGGDIVTFLGGSEIDLSQADIVGTARLDVTQVMGGTKIIVPAHWEVRSEVTALFAGFEDKRQQPAMINPDKVLIIDGTSIFGGIELKNY
jgi:predicted membrane protein